jgi:hypothetical protein
MMDTVYVSRKPLEQTILVELQDTEASTVLAADIRVQLPDHSTA